LKLKIIKTLAIFSFFYLLTQTTNAASFSLTSSKPHNVNITIDTQGQNSRGADAIIYYNEKEIEIININNGNIYETYPRSSFSNGVIRITGYSTNKAFNGRGILAEINLKSIKDIETSTMHFNFTPGLTSDSNISGENMGDILNSVNNLQLQFNTKTDKQTIKQIKNTDKSKVIQKKSTSKQNNKKHDNEVPWIENLLPKSGSKNILPNTNITFSIKDDKSGVDLSSLTIKINNILYTEKGINQFSYEGEPNEYHITIDPTQDLLEQENINIIINAKDIAQNGMPPLTHNFSVYNPPKLEITHKSAPIEDKNKIFPTFIITILIVSIVLNIIFLLSKRTNVQFIKSRIKTRKRR